MSDSDDWENDLDAALDDKPKEEPAKAAATEQQKKFDEEEDKYDSDEEEAKKKAAAAAQQKQSVPKEKPKNKFQLYDEKQKAKNQKAAKLAAQAANIKGSAAAKGEMISKAAEEDITNQLFAAEISTSASSLTSEKNYVDFARQVSDVLYDG